MKFALGAISTIWLIFAIALLSQVVSTSSNTTQTSSTTRNADDAEANVDLDKAETKDAKNLEIIKQIRRVNNDGSYTVGYEADDGTFKIESRDVLGNVKGTYGYVDENGDIKRVSYTANNATNGLKSTLAPSSTVEDVVHIPRQNRTNFPSSTTRRPASLAYLTSTASPARTNTAQSIPKRRILLSSANRAAHKHLYSSSLRKNDATTSTTKKVDPTATLVFATSVPLQRTTKVTSTTQTPVTNTILTTPAGTERTTKVEISGRISRVLNMNKERITTTEKPVVETVDEGESQTERKPLRGNFLRRQLPDEAHEQFEAQQQVVYSSQASAEDNGHAFGGLTGTVRPIFSTTSSPRIPALVLAARNRAALLKTAQLSSTTEKIYSKPPRRKTERRGEEDEPNTEPSSENSYLTQSPIPVQIPPNRDPSQTSENEQRVYRRPPAYLPRTRQYRVPIPSQPVNAEYDGDQQQQQYLRETTDPNESGKGSAATAEQYINGDANAAGYNSRFPRPYQQQIDPQQQSQQAQQSFPLPLPYPPYHRPFPNLHNNNNNYYNNLDRPLTARDFERLLNMLALRYQQFQRFNYLPGLMNPYSQGYGPPGYGPPPPPGYGPYPQFGYQQIPRPPVYHQYDPRYGGYRPSPLSQPSLYPYTDQENMYQAQNPIPDQQQQQVPYTGHRLTPRRKQYGQQYFGAQNALYGDRPEYEGDESQQSLQQASSDYLPSDVREELLYRMLMLAIQPETMMNTVPIPEASTMHEYIKSTDASASTAEPSKASKKPVRSVQILGEE